jgi:hypothetical protein
MTKFVFFEILCCLILFHIGNEEAYGKSIKNDIEVRASSGGNSDFVSQGNVKADIYVQTIVNEEIVDSIEKHIESVQVDSIILEEETHISKVDEIISSERSIQIGIQGEPVERAKVDDRPPLIQKPFTDIHAERNTSTEIIVESELQTAQHSLPIARIIELLLTHIWSFF